MEKENSNSEQKASKWKSYGSSHKVLNVYLSCILFSHKIAKEVSLYFCEKEPTLECIRPIQQHIIFYL